MIVVIDVDASKVIEAVRSTGVVITRPMIEYAHYLISNMKNIGTWQLSSAVYGMVGGTAGSHKWNWKDLRDLDSAFRLSFFNTPTHNSTGVLWNGVNQYANTFLTPSVSLSSSSTHLSYYTPTNSISGIQIPIGSTDVTPRFLQLNLTSANYASGLTASISAYTPTTTNGYTIGVRDAINSQSVFYRGVKIASNTFNGSTDLATIPIWIGGRNGNSSLQFPSIHTASYASIGAGLTDTQATQQSQIVTNAQLILNRA